MLVLRAENYRRMPWKNGGGETVEIVVSPEGAGLGEFDWRVSMARVEADGPFSVFPGVDRTLSILEGDGVVLYIEGREPVTLTGASAPYGFPADAATHAKLLSGPITDLNVMTRRGHWRHRVSARHVDGSTQLGISSARALLICGSGGLLVSHGDPQERLGRFDAALVDGGAALALEGSAQFFLVEFEVA